MLLNRFQLQYHKSRGTAHLLFIKFFQSLISIPSCILWLLYSLILVPRSAIEYDYYYYEDFFLFFPFTEFRKTTLPSPPHPLGAARITLYYIGLSFLSLGPSSSSSPLPRSGALWNCSSSNVRPSYYCVCALWFRLQQQNGGNKKKKTWADNVFALWPRPTAKRLLTSHLRF